MSPEYACAEGEGEGAMALIFPTFPLRYIVIYFATTLGYFVSTWTFMWLFFVVIGVWCGADWKFGSRPAQPCFVVSIGKSLNPAWLLVALGWCQCSTLELPSVCECVCEWVNRIVTVKRFGPSKKVENCYLPFTFVRVCHYGATWKWSIDSLLAWEATSTRMEH